MADEYILSQIKNILVLTEEQNLSQIIRLPAVGFTPLTPRSVQPCGDTHHRVSDSSTRLFAEHLAKTSSLSVLVPRRGPDRERARGHTSSLQGAPCFFVDLSIA